MRNMAKDATKKQDFKEQIVEFLRQHRKAFTFDELWRKVELQISKSWFKEALEELVREGIILKTFDSRHRCVYAHKCGMERRKRYRR